MASCYEEGPDTLVPRLNAALSRIPDGPNVVVVVLVVVLVATLEVLVPRVVGIGETSNTITVGVC